MPEPTLTDIIQWLDVIDKRLDGIEKKLEKLDVIEKQLTTLESRFLDFTMRVVSVNQSAFYENHRNIESISICDSLSKLHYQKLRLEHELGLIKKWKPNGTI